MTTFRTTADEVDRGREAANSGARTRSRCHMTEHSFAHFGRPSSPVPRTYISIPLCSWRQELGKVAASPPLLSGEDALGCQVAMARSGSGCLFHGATRRRGEPRLAMLAP